MGWSTYRLEFRWRELALTGLEHQQHFLRHQNKSGNNSTHLEVPIVAVASGLTCSTFFTGRICVIDGARFRISRHHRPNRSHWSVNLNHLNSLRKKVFCWALVAIQTKIFAPQDEQLEGFVSVLCGTAWPCNAFSFCLCNWAVNDCRWPQVGTIRYSRGRQASRKGGSIISSPLDGHTHIFAGLSKIFMLWVISWFEE